jgi:hypothetical protein
MFIQLADNMTKFLEVLQRRGMPARDYNFIDYE